MPNSRHPARNACRGRSLVETLVALTLIAALILIALDRLVTVRVEAERLAMENVIAALRAAALQHSLHNKTTGDARSFSPPPSLNPMTWLVQPPANYLGELAGPDPADLPGGQWYFDTVSQLLVYRVDFETYFDSSLPGVPRARFKLGIRTAATDRDRRTEPNRQAVQGITIEAKEPYTWRRHPISLSALKIWGVVGSHPE